MGNALRKRQRKLQARVVAYERSAKGKAAKSYKKPGSMNTHKQLGDKP